VINVAMIGLGWWGKKMFDLLNEQSKEIRIVRVVEPNLDAAMTVLAEYGIPVTQRYEDALEDPEVHAVILATPHALHTTQIALAVAAGKHIFCEKPLALTCEEAKRSVEACRAKGLVLGMGHERRFEPPIKEVFERFSDGSLGRILQIEANFSHDKFLGLDPKNWRLDASHAPAGGMTATGIHLLDLGTALMGAAKEVVCTCENLASSLPQGDTVSAYVRFVEGGTLYVSASLATPFISRFAVYGTKGWIDIRDKAHVEKPEGWVVTQAFGSGPIVVVDVPPAEPVKDNLEAFAKAIAYGQPYPITGEQMVRNIALLEAIFKSAKSGQLEAVPS
jgi:predicted dehydrogenase